MTATQQTTPSTSHSTLPAAIAASDVTVTPVVTAADKKAFIAFQYEVYKGNPYFVPPLLMDREEWLNPKKNPWYQFGTADLFLARRGGQVVGRIAAVLDPRYNEFHGTNVGWFGLFECINDGGVAKAMLETVETWCKARKLDEVMGPASFSSNGEWAFLLEGFDKAPAVQMPYTHEYYLKLMESCGYGKAKDLFAWRIDITKGPPEKVARIAEKVKQREGITIRIGDVKNWDREIRIIKELYNAAWEKNWGFVPMTDAEFDKMGKELKLVLEPKLVLFAEVNGEPVGFCITMPDANVAIKEAKGRLTTFGMPIGLVKMLLALKRIKQGRLIALGIKKEFRKRGLDSVLMYETVARANKLGWWGGEIGWTLEDNHLVNRAIEVFGAEKYKQYRIYKKPLTLPS